MDITIQAVFPSSALAHSVVDRLPSRINRGVEAKILEPGDVVKEPLHGQTNRAMAFALWGSAMGAVGMLFGAMVALLFPIPDRNPAWDTFLALVLGAVGGGLMGYFTGAILLASTLAADEKNVDQKLSEGATVVRVESEADSAAQICQIMIDAGARRSDGTPGVERSDEIGLDHVVA